MKSKTIHLKQNERPIPPPSAVRQAAAAALPSVHRYPSMHTLALRQAVAEKFDVQPDWVVAASGSVNVIQQAMLVAGQGEIAFCWPSFDAFPQLATARGMDVKLAGVRPDGSCDLVDLKAQVNVNTKMIIICTPNTPTGGIVSHREVADFVADLSPGIIVVLDEAYGEFVDDPGGLRAMELVRMYPNVMMTRTFSKAYGLAGMRVGYGIAQPELARAVAQAGVPYAISQPAEMAAIKALAHDDHMKASVAKVKAERARLTRRLRDRGMEVVEGHGNFIWLPRAGDEEALTQHLAAKDILVKVFAGHGIRISVGSRRDTDQLLAAWPDSI